MKDFTLDDIKRLIEQSLLEQPTGDDWLDSRYNEQVHYIGHTNPYYRLFWLIARELKPALSVELGSWQATASSHLALGNPAGQVITVDIHKDDLAAKIRTQEAANRIPNLTYLNAWTWDAAPQIPSGIELLFIDAWHDYQYAKREWNLYFPKLADLALVICDDITVDYNFEGMNQFWEEMPEPKFLDSRPHPGIPVGFIKFSRNLENVESNRSPNTIQQATPSKRGRPRKKS